MIEISNVAVAKIKELVATNNVPVDTGGARFGLEGGGCAGFKYFFKPEVFAAADDAIFEVDGVRIFVDPISLTYLDGSKIDWGWTEHSMGEGFKIDNPSAKGICGCGSSITF